MRTFFALAAFCLVSFAILTGGCQPTAPVAQVRAVTPDPKDDLRMPWAPASSGFWRDWLVLGPLPNPPLPKDKVKTAHPVGAGFDADYLGGEAAARPSAGQTVKLPDGRTLAWTAYTSDRDTINFAAAFEGVSTDNVAAYAFRAVHRPQAGRALLSIGSDDSVKVYLNGQLVHSNIVGRGIRADDDLVAVDLKAGDNALLVKVESPRGGWGFICRMLSEAQVAGLEAGDLRPRLEEQPDGTLTLQTDTGVGALGAASQTVLVEVVAPAGKVLTQSQARRSESIRLDPSPWPDGPYEIRLTHAGFDGRKTFIHLAGYRGDWVLQARALLEECDKLSPMDTSVRALRLRVLRDFVLERLGGDVRARPTTGKAADTAPQAWRKIHGTLMEHRELDDRDAVRPLGFVRLAWIDPIDDSRQFARAYLPPGYAADRKWPLVVNLHGYNPSNPAYVNWWSSAERHNRMAERHGVIELEPHGRGNTGYSGIGLADVLRSVEMARKTFSVDPQRIYVMGYSMGGGGTWHVGTRCPDLFAAIAPIYGGWDYHTWMEADKFAKLTPWQRFTHEAGGSFALAESLLTTPVFINHGDRDELVKVDHSRYVVRMLQRWGYDVRYWEHPGKGHGGLGCEDEIARFFLARTLRSDPAEVRMRSGSLRDARAHWLRVEQSADPTAFICATARVTAANTVRLDSQNVLEARLSPGAALVDPSKPLRVIWNGEDAGQHDLSAGSVLVRAAGYTPPAMPKTPALCGPLGDATNTPFAIVRGTIARDARMAAFCRLRAEGLRESWRRWQHVEPRYFLDTQISEDQIRRYSLILFGGPDENLVARRLAADIPLRLEPDAITVAGHRYAARNAAVSMIRPHPLNPARYVVINAGNSPDGMFFTDRLPDEMDFVIVDDVQTAGSDDIPFEDRAIACGLFDRAWQLDPRYTQTSKADARAKLGRRRAPTLLSAASDASRLMLSQLLETSSAGSFSIMQRGSNWSGKPMRLGGRAFADGIAVQAWHEECAATYDLAGGQWKRLRATLGIEIDDPSKLEDRHKKGTRVFFVVRGDGKELYRSPTFKWDSPPADMDIDVSGVQVLELKVANESTWNNAASSVNWADLRLEK